MAEHPFLAAFRQSTADPFRRVVESVLDYAIVILDSTGTIVSWAPGAEGLFGFRSAEIVGRHVSVLFPGVESAELAVQAELQATRQLGRWEQECLRVRKDGSRFWANVTLSCLSDSAGALAGYVKIARDASDRKRELDGWKRQARMMDQTREAIVSWQAGGIIHSWNRGAELLYGYAAAEVVGLNGHELLRSRPTGESWAAVIEKLQTQGYWEGELTQTTRSGGDRVVETHLTNVGLGGDFLVVEIDRDVTQRNRQEQLLRDSENRYRKLFDANPHPMWVFDLESLRFLAVNDAAIAHYGYSRDEFLALTIADIRPAEDVELLKAHLARKANGLEDAGIWRHRRRDGSLIIVEISSHSLLFDGRPAELVLAHDITEQRKIEEALRRNQAHLRAIVDTEPECVKLLDPLGGLLEMNPAGLKMIEADSFQQVAQQCVYPMVVEADREAFRRMNEGVFAGRPGHLEFQMVGLRGTARWLETHATPLRDETGQVIGSLGITRDITERKLAEATAREVQERLQLFIAHAPAALAMFDREMRYLAVSHRWLQDYKLSAANVLGHSHYEVFPEIPDRWREVHRRCLAGEVIQATDDFFERADGFQQWLRWEVRPWFTVDQQVGGIVIFSEDITEIKRVELNLRDSEARLRMALDAAQMGIFDWDIPRNRITWSHWHEVLFGFKTGEFGGSYQAFAERVHAEDLPGVNAEVNRCIANREPFSREFRVVWPDGSVHWIVGTGQFEFGADNEALRMRGVVRDITHQLQLEKQLQQAQKMEAIGQLAGGIAHDFNNLLTVIYGFSDFLLSSPIPNGPQREALQAIHEAGTRAASLTRQLLAFSRQSVLQPKVLDLNAVVSDTEKMLRRLIGEDIQLQVDLQPDLPAVKVDPGQMAQVLMNLVINARDAMPQGGRLTILTKTQTGFPPASDRSTGNRVQLSICDTGSGMTREVQARIFEPFFTTKGPGKGTGLGLATVYGIVKQSGGTIEVHSEIGRGSQFDISLPAAHRTDPPAAVSIAKPHLRGRETILLVEDEHAVRRLALIALQSYGYLVLEAAQGREALALFESHRARIDLLVTDMVMPEMSGRELANRLIEQAPDLKVLFVSGYTDDGLAQPGLDSSRIGFLPKPYSPEELAERVRAVLQSDSAAPAVRSRPG